MTTIKGIVTQGKQIARQIGFPTANVYCFHSIETGVWTGTITIQNKLLFNCLIYITQGLIECHIPNWEGNLYNQEVIIEIEIFIRPDILFECLDQVVTQIKKDLVIYNLINSLKGFSNSKNFISFSGGKESCILIDILQRLQIPFDLIHFKPKEQPIQDLLGFENVIVKEYTSFEQAVKDFDHYDFCFLGVRKDDCSFKESTWLKNCQIIKPLFDWSYQQVWDYIENYNVKVSEKYSQGYTSVGYNSKPNILLKRFDNGYIHAKYLNNFDTERKKW